MAWTKTGTIPATVITDANLAPVIDDPLTAAVLDGKYGHRLYHLDSYNAFLSGKPWVTGQANAGTTLTAAVSAGASVLPVNSASLIIPGMQLLVAEGTVNQKIYEVVSVSVNNVTIVGTTAFALASGAPVSPLWSNSSHLTVNGYTALARFIAQAKDADGNFIIGGTTPKVTYLGNSWISQGLTSWATQLQARIPGAVVVNAGIAGNTSAMMLARFGTDVPADSDYVVFNEPGVNDDTGFVSTETELANLAALASKALAIGAIPIYTGHVPLSDLPVSAAARQAMFAGLIGDGTRWPAVAAAGLRVAFVPESKSIGIGTGALITVTTGVENTVVGQFAGDAITTALANTLIGREAGTALTTGNSNTGIGQNTLRALASGTNNVAIGQGAGSALTGSGLTGIGALAGLLATTGTDSTHIGKSAGYAPNNVPANATTTGVNQTNIGSESGQGSATAVNGITTIGRRAIASGASATAIGTVANAQGNQSTAIGTATLAGHNGGVAIGTDTGGAGASTSADNEIALGTANHTVKVLGKVKTAVGSTTQAGINVPHGAAPTTPVDGDMWTTTAGLYVRVNGVTVGPLT